MTTKIDVSKLKKRPVPAGHKMKYRHHYDGSNPKRLVATDAWLETDNGFLAAEATAVCNPKDVPIKKLGVAIAHNRCIKQFEKLDHAD